VATPCKHYIVVSQPKIAKKPKIIALGGNRKPVYDFLSVTNSNLGPISHWF